MHLKSSHIGPTDCHISMKCCYTVATLVVCIIGNKTIILLYVNYFDLVLYELYRHSANAQFICTQNIHLDHVNCQISKSGPEKV